MPINPYTIASLAEARFDVQTVVQIDTKRVIAVDASPDGPPPAFLVEMSLWTGPTEDRRPLTWLIVTDGTTCWRINQVNMLIGGRIWAKATDKELSHLKEALEDYCRAV